MEAGSNIRNHPEVTEIADCGEGPDFVQVKGNRCGHRHAGIHGCLRCIEFCECKAISAGRIMPQIDFPACRRCANCVTACPIDVIQLTAPGCKKVFHQASVQAAESAAPSTLVFHGYNVTFAEIIPSTGHIFIIEFEPIGALGMESILALLAAGAAGVFIVPGPDTTRRTIDLLDEQVQWARLIAEGLGEANDRIVLMEPGEDIRLPLIPHSIERLKSQWNVSYNQIPDFEQPKRSLALWAMEKLANRNFSGKQTIPLPAGAPYGEVVFDSAKCSFCMACTSLCPTGALSSAGEIFPKLVFTEAECIQCGLCVSGCPEEAIRLNPGMDFCTHLNRTPKSLKQEVPFHCERCGNPFATRSMIEAMAFRLTGHWMFATDAEKRRLRLCRTCRVKDVYENPEKDG